MTSDMAHRYARLLLDGCLSPGDRDALVEELRSLADSLERKRSKVSLEVKQ